MSIKIGHASIDENGKIVNGKVGDQTTKEICIREWYDKHWNVYIECTDENIADKAATYMEQICSDNNYGYDQNQRLTGYNSILNNDGKVKGGKGEFDCSSLVSSCYKFAGIDVSTSNTTRSIKEAFKSKGFKIYTDKDYLISDKYARRGGMYLSEGHHVLMALENGYGYAVKNEPIFKRYVVVKGDSLSKISLKFLGKANRYNEIMILNNLKSDVINIGQTLKIPNK
jgi:hypothetical protein